MRLRLGNRLLDLPPGHVAVTNDADVHRSLLEQQTPSVLVGVALVDAVGERRAQNQPGTNEEYPNWKVPLADGAGRLVTLDELFDNPRLRSLVAALQR